MNLMRFRVYTGMAESPTQASYDLTILPADRMRAERFTTTELPPSQRGKGAAKLFPESYLFLWLWCAATRQAVTSDGFSTWVDTMLDYDRLGRDGEPVGSDTEPDDDELDEPVDPTQPVEPTSGP